MRYTINDNVKILVKKVYGNGDSINIGTKGTIISVEVMNEAYMVMFEGARMAHGILETDLEDA